MFFRTIGILLAVSATGWQGMAAEREITINIYNGGFSQVTEKRQIEIKKGQKEVEIYDIPEGIDPGSISIKGEGFGVRWIDYRYDFISAERLLHKFIGKEIQFQKGDSLVKGILIRYDSKYLFLSTHGWPGPVSIYERDDLKNIDLPALPEGLVSRPTINLGLDSGGSGKKGMELSYLTSGLGWQAEYQLNFNRKDKAAFSGWVKLDNQCGLSFPAASIVLIAGQVDRAKPAAGSGDAMATGKSGAGSESPLEALVDYQHYKLPFKTAISEMETKQAVMFSSMGINVEHFYRYKWSETKSAVKAIVAFDNNKESGLGIPMPPGRMSIYDGQTRTFLGSAEFDGAAAGEKAEIVMGTAFDIATERSRTDHRKLGRNRNADSYEIRIRNHKAERIKVVISEELYGYWEITEKSDEFTRKDFQTVEFDIKVPAGGEKVITYTVEYGY